MAGPQIETALARTGDACARAGGRSVERAKCAFYALPGQQAMCLA